MNDQTVLMALFAWLLFAAVGIISLLMSVWGDWRRGKPHFANAVCPRCGQEQRAPVVNGGSGYNHSVGQLEYWHECYVECSCGFKGCVQDSSL